MIDNFGAIVPYLGLKGIYHVQINQRSKDGHDKSTRLIAEWFVTSPEKLLFLKPAIVLLCDQYMARAYINLNNKQPEEVTYKLIEKLFDSLKSKNYNLIQSLSSAVDTVNGQHKIWVVDVDNDSRENLDLICSRINQCRSGMTVNVRDVISTKNGYHILTCPFDMSQLNRDGISDFEVKKNAMTLLYCF